MGHCSLLQRHLSHPEAVIYHDCYSQLYMSCSIDAPALNSFIQINNENVNSTELKGVTIQFRR